MEKLKTKNTKTKIIIEEKTHFFVFFLPIFIATAMLLYFIIFQIDTNIFLYLLILGVIFLKCLSLFYKKKIVISDKKIYIYIRGKKFISWSFPQDFNMITYNQSYFGKFFNFGTLTIVNKNKEMYEYHFLKNPKNVYENIIITYENLMKKLDPSFIFSYIDNNKELKNKIDSLEK